MTTTVQSVMPISNLPLFLFSFLSLNLVPTNPTNINQIFHHGVCRELNPRSLKNPITQTSILENSVSKNDHRDEFSFHNSNQNAGYNTQLHTQ